MDDDARQQALLNALVTEHLVLQSARGVTTSEATGRASLYLTSLTGRSSRSASSPRSARSSAQHAAYPPLVPDPRPGGGRVLRRRRRDRQIDPSMYRSNLQLLFTAASMVAAINAVVAGAAITLLLRTLGAVGLGAATAAGVLVAVALFVLHLRHERRRFGALVSEPDAAARGSATAGERRR